MTGRKLWQVWSHDISGWVAVDKGIEAEAKGVKRREASAKRLGIQAEFVALPLGEKP